MAGIESLGERVVSLNVDSSAVFMGRIVTTTAGTAVQGGNIPLTDGVVIKGLKGNTGIAYIWWASGDGRTNGFELSPSEIMIAQVSNLNLIWIDSAVSGEGVCWIKV
jgi:hypothetical protein